MQPNKRPLSEYPSYIRADADTVLTDEQERRIFGNERLLLIQLERIGSVALASLSPSLPTLLQQPTREFAHADT